MAIYIQFSAHGRSFGRGKGKLHGMAYGAKIITPSNLDLSLFQMASDSSQPTGHTSGRRHHNPIVIVKEVDSASPLLWQACCTNEVLQSVDLTLVRSGGTGGHEQVVATIKLTNAEISKVDQYHPHLILPPKKPKHGNSTQHIHTNELEEFSVTFMEVTYTIVMKSKAGSDDWSATT